MSNEQAGRVRWKERLILGAWLLAVVISFAAYGRRSEDLSGYVATGNAVLSQIDIYQGTPPGVNTWPPFFSLTCVPLALLNKAAPLLTSVVWVALLWGSVFVILELLAWLIYKKKFTLISEPSTLSLSSSELIIPFFLAFPYVVSNFEHLQCDIILFALTLGGLYLQSSRREGWGGLALGAAAATKVMAILFVPYLLYRRRWRAACYAAAGTALFSVSPVLVFGWRRSWQDWGLWVVAVHRGWGTGTTNQSLYAMWDRILGYGFVPFLHAPVDILLPSEAQIVKTAWAATLIVVLLLVIVALRGEPRPDSLWAQAEWSIVFILSALSGPVMWKHYLVVLMLPYALIYAAFRSPKFSGQRRALGTILAVSFLLSVPTLHDVIGKRLGSRLEMGSIVTFGTLVMLGGLLWFRGRTARQKSSQFGSVSSEMRVDLS